MRIGVIIQLHGRQGPDGLAEPGWSRLREQVQVAERTGFDSVVFEDALLYPTADGDFGLWEAVAIAGAIAEATTSIEFGPSVFNGVYRSPTLLAKAAETLDEVSGGRFIFGLGAGNTPDDYPPFGFRSDHRYSRFAEALEIIHAMMKMGSATLEGEYWRADQARMVIRGPRPQGPPIVLAAGGPKMMRLAARFADEWNWWPQGDDPVEAVQPMVTELEKACEENGRDPRTLRRSLDLYSVDPLGLGTDGRPVQIAGSGDEIAEKLLDFRSIFVDEVRCDLITGGGVTEPGKKVAAIEAMADIVRIVQAG